MSLLYYGSIISGTLRVGCLFCITGSIISGTLPMMMMFMGTETLVTQSLIGYGTYSRVLGY